MRLHKVSVFIPSESPAMYGGDNGIVFKCFIERVWFKATSFLTGFTLFSLFVICGCSGSRTDGSISLSIHSIPPQPVTVLNTLSLPQHADNVIITITGKDFSPIVKDVSVAANPSGVTINGIPEGYNRTVGVEVKDASGAVIARGKTTGIRIIAGSVNNVDTLITGTGVFTRLESKPIPRAFAVSSQLPDGTYIIMGGIVKGQSPCGQGCVQYNATSQTERYDPKTGTFSPGPQMTETRVFFTANALSDGSIAVIGGTDIVNINCNMTACSITVPGEHTKTSIEVYDPVSDNFYKGLTLTMPRAGHTADILTGDTLLISGGISTNRSANSAELVDIKTGKFATYAMSFARSFQTTVVYSDDEVFLACGNSAGSNAEFFQLSGFTLSNNITCTTYFPSSAFIHDEEEILVNGGVNAYWQPVSQLMLIDPFNRVVHSYYSMTLPRALFSDILLGDGNVLIAGGITTPVFTPTCSAEVFSPVSKSFVKYPSLSIPRAGYTAQNLQDGSALIVSGFSAINPLTIDITFPDTAEIYNP